MKKLQILVAVFLISLSICALASMRVLGQTNPTLTTTAPSDAIAGVSFVDIATLPGATSDAGGTVNYTLYSGISPSGTQVGSISVVTVTDGVVPNSDSFTVTTAGSYYFSAVYSGDSNNNQATATPEPFTVTAGLLSKFVVDAPTSATVGTAFTLKVTAEDASGNTITTYSSSVGLSASSGTISPASTGTSGWSSGIWSGSVTLSAAGSITITASVTGATGVSGSITVTAGLLSKFVVDAPTSATVGTAFTLKVTAEDASGNTITTFSSSVGLSASSGTISPASTGTSGWSSGIWSGSVTLSAAGSITITASVTGATGVSGSITVTAGLLSKFVVDAPTSATVGTAFTLKVTAEDASGNTITTFSSSVGLSASSGTISPASTGTSGWSSGIWSGSVTLSAAGSITITASVTGATGVSGSITVTAGLLSKFVVDAPTSATVGTAFTLKVTAEDASGNTITTFSSSVGLSASSGTISPASTGTSGWSSGIWSGSVTLSAAGSITITASVTGATGVSGSITVTAGLLSKFVVDAPTSATVGTAFTLKVTAEDASGNTITTFSSSVGLSASSGPDLSFLSSLFPSCSPISACR